MDSSVNLLTPYSQSHTHDELEEAMQSVFITAFHELYGEAIRDIHHFGMPHLGSPKVVERFSKQDGLVVLRRPNYCSIVMVPWSRPSMLACWTVPIHQMKPSARRAI